MLARSGKTVANAKAAATVANAKTANWFRIGSYL